MPYTEQAFERIKISGTIFTSKNLQAGSSQTATIDMGNFRRLIVISAAQGTAATTTVPHATIKILDSTAAGSAVHTAIVKGTIMSQTAGFARYRYLSMESDDITQNIAAPGSTVGRFVRVRVIYGTRATQVAVAAIGMDPRFSPQSNTYTAA